MIKPIIQKKPYKPDIGDILSGGEYIKKNVRDVSHVAGKSDEFKTFFGDIGKGFISIYGNPWEILEDMNIETADFKKIFQYECPYTGNTYYHFIPIAIIVNHKSDVQQYRQLNFASESYDYRFDLEWILKMQKIPEIDDIGRSMLGHGFTSGTLPSDGDGKFIRVLIELDNGDHLFGHCWEWYNK